MMIFLYCNYGYMGLYKKNATMPPRSSARFYDYDMAVIDKWCLSQEGSRVPLDG